VLFVFLARCRYTITLLPEDPRLAQLLDLCCLSCLSHLAVEFEIAGNPDEALRAEVNDFVHALSRTEHVDGPTGNTFTGKTGGRSIRPLHRQSYEHYEH
jgi:hypothetical protein